MALNLQIFRERALTAVIFVVIMLAGVLWNKWSFIILFTIIHFGCWYEFVKLTQKIKPFLYGYFLPVGLLYITLPIMMMISLGFPFLDKFLFNKEYIEEYKYSPLIPCGVIFSIWINDTMAYIVGSFIGKTPFSKISPKKTWEGTLGGVILCVLTITLISWLSNIFTIKDWVIIAATCAVLGTIGDLLESKIKRLAKVKDSGSLMPGHGGFLDRFDSLLTATPFVWVYVNFFMG